MSSIDKEEIFSLVDISGEIALYTPYRVDKLRLPQEVDKFEMQKISSPTTESDICYECKYCGCDINGPVLAASVGCTGCSENNLEVRIKPFVLDEFWGTLLFRKKQFTIADTNGVSATPIFLNRECTLDEYINKTLTKGEM